MKKNINEAMASGVENAAVIIPLLSQKYQDSHNCKKELNYADDLRVPIVPVMAEKNWKQSGWLGALLAGLLWVDFAAIPGDRFQGAFEHLLREIVNVWANAIQKGRGAPLQEWGVKEVEEFFTGLGFGEPVTALVNKNQIDGKLLTSLSQADFTEYLNLTGLMLKKLTLELDALKADAAKKSRALELKSSAKLEQVGAAASWSASSQYDGDHSPQNAKETSLSAWASAQGEQKAWIMAAFPTAVALSKVDIRWGPCSSEYDRPPPTAWRGAIKFTVEAEVQGAWRTIWQEMDNRYEKPSVTVLEPPLEGVSRVRLNCLERNAGQDWFYLYQVFIWAYKQN
eukprot:g12756.t1